MSLFGNGWKELGRRWRRSGLRRQLAAHDRKRTELLGQLGQAAIDGGVDLSGYAGLQAQILQLKGRAGELAEIARTLEARRAELQERRRVKNAEFDAQRQDVDSRKRASDKELTTARDRQAQHEEATRSAEAQALALPKELEQLRQRLTALGSASSPDKDSQIAAADARIAQIEQLQPQLAEQIRAAPAAAAPLAAEVARHLAESERLAAETLRLETERRVFNQSVDSEIGSTTQELRATGQSSQDVEKDRTARCIELGTALYSSGRRDGAIAAATVAVVAEDERRVATQAALDASLAESAAMPRGAFGRFVAATLAILLLAVALPLGGWLGWQWWLEKKADEEYAALVEQVPLNPYLEHPLKNEPAYLLANQLVEAETPEEAYAVLLKVFDAIGLGVYTPDGKQIQMGAEQSERDFFLYDFQARILAATEMHPSYLPFANFSYVLGGTILELEQPAELEPVLAIGVARHYGRAAANPKDPNSFIMLFIDGLARHQPIPYSLEILESGSSEYPVSPVQSILLVMEFFMGQPSLPTETARARADTPAVAWLAKPLLLIPGAHAQGGPCEFIQGETDRKHYGWGIAAINELAEELPGRIETIAKGFDKLTAGIEAVGDLLMLYGLDIHVQPQPYAIHLRHEGPVDARIVATITFDPQVVSDEVLKCGWMAGKQMPTKGPLPNVETSWAFSRELPPYLVMDPKTPVRAAGSVGLKTTTDRAGRSIFYLQASECVDRRGRILGQDYMAIVTARVVTTNIPSPTLMLPRVITKFAPGMLEYFMEGRKGYARFRAEWHKKRPREPQYGTT